MMTASMIEVRFERGIHLPEADLWLDPWEARDRAFVSHAHADHFARHGSILCSETTAILARERFRARRHAFHPRQIGMPWEDRGFRFRLMHAGHIVGSAMLHATRLRDGASLLYTGDFKTRAGRTCEEPGWIHADMLIMETTFGRPEFRFPAPSEVEDEVLSFIGGTLAEGRVPVLLGYSLGKAQEAIALLHDHAVPMVAHPGICRMTDVCRSAGIRLPTIAAANPGEIPPGHVVIAPPQALRSPLLHTIPHRRSAMLSGWGIQPGAKFRYKVDRVIPWSDHADHEGLWECVRRVAPRHVITVHGFDREFAAELRSSGIDAWSARGHDQLDLPGIIRPAANG